ncbi:MAG: hypothetical protein KA313_05890 [Pseudarcicella sp.]|nr:hypothetical protein [Pseudarcicella sp.]MBP6410612.1 hypothetical protein [Pseudarcicella sp.]
MQEPEHNRELTYKPNAFAKDYFTPIIQQMLEQLNDLQESIKNENEKIKNIIRYKNEILNPLLQKKNKRIDKYISLLKIYLGNDYFTDQEKIKIQQFIVEYSIHQWMYLGKKVQTGEIELLKAHMTDLQRNTWQQYESNQRNSQTQTLQNQDLVKPKDIKTACKSLYKSLIKEFHPDKIQHLEQEFQINTIAQNVILAYKKNDLISLLKLTQQYQPQNQELTVAEKTIIAELKANIKQTENEMIGIINQQQQWLGIQTTLVPQTIALQTIEMILHKEKNTLKQENKNLEIFIQQLSNKETFRAFLGSN